MITRQRASQTSILNIGTVIDIHMNDAGVTLFSVEDSLGQVFYPCTMMSMIAGADGRFTLSAPTLGSVVVILSNTQASANNYFILGGIPHPEDSCAVRVDGIRTALDADEAGGTSYVLKERSPYYVNQDYEQTHVSDYHVQNLNSYINLSDVHGMTLRGSPRVSIEIGDDSASNVFRIAAGGYAGNRVLNAEGFMNKLFDYLGELQAKVEALENAVNAISPSVIATMTATGGLMNATAPGTGQPLIDQAIQVSDAQTQLTATPAPRSSDTVRDDCESDKNPYIIIP